MSQKQLTQVPKLIILTNSMSQNANNQGRFVIIKTKLTIKGKGECKRRGDYIYIVRG
jgi:hypothetical protein